MKVYKPETPGGYCFPPIGTLITGAARLILGMLEKLVVDAGGIGRCVTRLHVDSC